MSSLRSLALAALAAACLTAAGAHAQPYSGRDFDDDSGYGAQPRAPNLDDLHDALKLTPAQDDAWRAFAAASAPDGAQQARARSAQQMLPTLSAPQRVDLSIAAMEADLETLRRRGAALKAFYAQLTPAQQQTFDRQTLPRQ
ncbi:MAG TPA: Spy/CpxP family protein refolding chaperone [Caulobacteraceae bacterium]|jgi:hypothetical protein